MTTEQGEHAEQEESYAVLVERFERMLRDPLDRRVLEIFNRTCQTIGERRGFLLGSLVTGGIMIVVRLAWSWWGG